MVAGPDILLIDDDLSVRSALTAMLRGRRITTAGTKAEGLARFCTQRPRIVFLDVRLPDGDGLSLIDAFLGLEPFTQVVVVTGYADVELVMRALRSGAADILEKPCAEEAVQQKLERAERNLSRNLGSPQLKGDSAALRVALDRVLRVALTTSLPALVMGESGTGKDLAARAIHALSKRVGGPFVAVNCAALPDALLEAELFGYERGAFTGALAEGKKGLFEVAAGGTILLDEIGEASPTFQASLLRVLEQRTIRRVGGIVERPIDARVVAATNRDLAAQVEAGRFRADLFYRLSVAVICMPPLRERKEDVSLLAHHFLEIAATEVGRALSGFSDEALEALERYHWPGNVREFKNVIMRAALFAKSPCIGVEDLELGVVGDPLTRPARRPPALESFRLDEAERLVIEGALAAADGNKLQAAKLLGITRSSLYNKLRTLGLELPDGEDGARRS